MMVRKLIFFLAVSLLTASQATAQTDPDATVKAFKAALLDFVNNKQGRVDQTEHLSDDLYQKFKKDPKVLVGIAEAYSTIKDTTYSYKFYNYAIALDPANMEPYVEAGKWEEADSTKQSYERALAWYNRAIKANPKDSTGYVRAARLLAKRMGRMDDAIKKIQEISAFNPDYTVNLFVAKMYSDIGMTDKAVEYYAKEKIEKLDPSELTDYANNCYFAGKDENGINVVDFGLQKYPRYPQLNRTGMLLTIRKKDNKATAEFGERLLYQTDNLKVIWQDYYNLAQAYSSLHKSAKAIEMYNSVIDFPEDSLSASEKSKLKDAVDMCYQHIGKLYVDDGEYDKAVSTYERYCEMRKSQGRLSAYELDLVAKVYMFQSEEMNGEDKLDCYRKANEVYERIEQEFPQNAGYALDNILDNCYRLDPEHHTVIAKPYAERLYAMEMGKGTEMSSLDKERLSKAARRLAYYYFVEANDKKTSLPYWRKVYEINPNDQGARQVLNIKK